MKSMSEKLNIKESLNSKKNSNKINNYCTQILMLLLYNKMFLNPFKWHNL